MSSEQIDKIIDKLNALVKILAVNILKDKNQTESILLLAEFGFDNKTIASLLGTKENIVRATKSNVTKSVKKSKTIKRVELKKDEEPEKNSEN
jgi:hypothetical protein